MKSQLMRIIAVLALGASLRQVAAQGTAFTYQGQLNSGGNAAEGSFDLTFGLFSVASGAGQDGATITNLAVGVTNGLFTVPLDFGTNFPGASRWLEISVRTNGGGAFTTLSPRQLLNPAPYAITAENVVAGGGIAGAYSNAVTFSNAANSFAGNGSGLTDLNATTLCGLACTDFWQLGGNAGTTPATDFLGTTDNEPLELRVNNAQGLVLYPGGTVVGGPGAAVELGSLGNTVFGGFYGGFNVVYPNYSTIAGGYNNTINSGAPESIIGGGQGNVIGGSTSFIGGGFYNTNNGTYGVIPGGYNNLVSGNYSFAAGCSAEATNAGAFVWADGSGGAFASTNNNQFSVRAMGGVSFVTGGAGMTIDGSPVTTGMGWSLSGNAGTSPATDFLGTTDNEPLELRVNNAQGLVLYPGGTVVGGPGAAVELGSLGNTVFGGFYGGFNVVYPNYSTIAGGYNNTINSGAPESIIGGGQGNVIGGSTSFIGGGFYNTNNGTYGVIPGGYNNLVSGNYGFAAGYNARATQSGSFVWSDGSGTATTSAAANSVTFRASGGFQILSTTGTAGVQLAPGGGAWTSLSDRNAKRHFEPVNTRGVLDKLAALPVSTWNYKTQDPSIRHIGPTAQDFKAAFAVGESDTGITTVDEEGVALAAIKGLNEKLEQSVKAKDAEIHSLQERLERLEKMMSRSPSQP